MTKNINNFFSPPKDILRVLSSNPYSFSKPVLSERDGLMKMCLAEHE